MGSQDRVSVEPEVCEKFGMRDEFEDERQEDMWSLIKPEPRAYAFTALLPGNGGKEFKESVLKPSWDLAPPKAYVPIARSRSSLSSDSLQLCTEGLGCESCDCLTDSASDESSSVSLDDYSSEDEDVECEEKIFPAALPPRSFPPPLPSLCASSASYMRSVKKDGRFVLQSVKMPMQNYLHSFREGGRLKMQLVTRAEDDFVLPATLIKPENEILHEEVDGGGGGGSDSEEIKSCSNDKFTILEKCSDIPDVQESVDSPKIPDALSVPGEKCEGCEIQIQNAVAELKAQGCKLNDNNKCAVAKSVENHEICDINPCPKTGSACFNVYSGWRSELAEQNCSDLCQNWQKSQSLPNYPINKLKHGEANNVDLNVNVNESCVHSKVPKFRLNDLGLGRCHTPKSLPVWSKSQCIATNS